MTDLPPRGPAKRPAEPRPPEDAPPAGEYASAGIQFAVSIILFLFAGQWVDRRFGTAPWGVLVGVFVGAGASFYSMYAKLMAAQERSDRRAREQRERDRGGSQP